MQQPPSIRQNKVSRMLQKELADIFQKENNTLYPKGIISVTKVRISPDLAIAKIYISIFPVDQAKTVLQHITEQTKHIRLLLGQRIRHQVRIIPELTFFIDDSLDYYEKIEQLLKN